MTKLETLQLKLTATRVRMGVIEATHGAGCGHPGGSLSAADVLTYLYFREMRIDPEQPQDPNRDRFVLSKGHCAPGLYATLAERGFFPVADLPTLRHSNSYLQGTESNCAGKFWRFDGEGEDVILIYGKRRRAEAWRRLLLF
jgi:transketolase